MSFTYIASAVRSRTAGVLSAVMLSLFVVPLSAQSMQHHDMTAGEPLGLSMTRMGSGTSWLPDSAPMYGVMRNAGAWTFMMHGSVFLQQVKVGGRRGASQFGSINWGMFDAMHPLAGGRLQLRSMLSLDAYTVGQKGYPLLLQTGEALRGEAIHDRQHPHDLFMEVAAVYERAVTRDVALQLYVAPSGEPALGPVAFPHRPSAAADPFATIAHHWQDATHVSFGVATAALYTRRVKVEFSQFNGREPDDVRTNFDFQGARLDSYAARVTVNPSSDWSLTASAGRLADAEKAHPGVAVRRVSASALWSHQRADGRARSLGLVTGANGVGHEAWSRSASLEALADVGARTQLFARVEAVEKSAEELVLPVVITVLPLPIDHHEAPYRVGQLSVGALRELAVGRAGRLGIGARATGSVVPSTLSSVYGSRTPVGGAIYLRWRTGRMQMSSMMHGM